jgi:methionine-rich copper-binding protein CopC
MQNMTRFRRLTLLLIVAVNAAFGHAVIVASSPRTNAVVKSPNVQILLRFNVQIDAKRSRVMLLGPDGKAKAITVRQSTSADSLSAEAAGLAPGKYKILWQVLAKDGHITQGEIPFTVAAP